MIYEVVEYKAGERKIWLTTDSAAEAGEEHNWLLDRKEQHDATMGRITVERKRG